MSLDGGELGGGKLPMGGDWYHSSYKYDTF